MEKDSNLEALTTIVNALKGLDKDIQSRTLQAVITYLDISMPSLSLFPHVFSKSSKQNDNENTSKNEVSFSENRSMSPKDFLREKSPNTDIDRITCLAYYLTHYRDMPHFKTIDLSTLNTEAAQPKLSNATVAMNNASLAGLLVQAGKGNKQISAAGELYVQALPDRNSAKEVLGNIRLRKRNKKSSAKNSKLNKI
jgi:hypothetical protein